MLKMTYTGNLSGNEIGKREIIKMKTQLGTLPKLPEMTDAVVTIIDGNTIYVEPSEDMNMDPYYVTLYQAVDENGEDRSFQTSSEIFSEALSDIYSSLEGEDVTIKITKHPSKKQAGYFFYRPELV